jgi:hypothetical protein
MGNPLILELEKRANYPNKPMNRAAMLRFYSKAKPDRLRLSDQALLRLGDSLIFLGTWLKSKYSIQPISPVLE